MTVTRPPRWLGERAILGFGIVLLALNLRPAVTSVGALLSEIDAALRLSAPLTGLLTTLPVLCFAGLGPVSAIAARRLGARRVLHTAIALLVAGLAVRVLLESPAGFFAGSVVALAGVAAANVLLPAIVKDEFPTRGGVVTALYTMALALGTMLGAGISVPVADATSLGWRGGIGIWAVCAAVAAMPWLWLALQPGLHLPPPVADSPRSIGLVRSRLAWMAAIYFGMQALNAYALFGWLPERYRDAGFSPTAAGALLALIPAISVPVSLAIPVMAARPGGQRLCVGLLAVFRIAGYLGLIVAPAAGAWIWAILIGLGGGSLSLALTMLGLHTRDAAVTAALSGFVQGIGYAMGAVGPLLVGLLHAVTGGWGAPLGLLVASVVAMTVAGWVVAGHGDADDDLSPQIVA